MTSYADRLRPSLRPSAPPERQNAELLATSDALTAQIDALNDAAWGPDPDPEIRRPLSEGLDDYDLRREAREYRAQLTQERQASRERRVGEYPGARQVRHARSTGTLVAVLDVAANRDLARSAADVTEPYMTWCEDHGIAAYWPTLKLAKYHGADPEVWCAGCTIDQNEERTA